MQATGVREICGLSGNSWACRYQRHRPTIPVVWGASTEPVLPQRKRYEPLAREDTAS
jgi:hypothetical protein